MNFSNTSVRRGRLSVAAAALFLFPPLLISAPASALEYRFGELELQLDTIVSASVGVRVQEQACDHISVWNRGCPATSGATFSENDDDGNVNVERGEIFSAPVKIISELGGKWQNYGFYVSGKAFYDAAIRNLGENENGKFGPLGTANNLGPVIADPQRRRLRDPYRGDSAYEAALSDIKLLDAYVYGNWDVDEQPLNVRLGRQVVSWGESTFVQGGVSSYLPLDVAALYQPGLELKEVFLPQGTAYASLGLPGNVTVEAMYIYEHEKSSLPACGTLFSVSDVLGKGCAYAVSKGDMFLDTATGNIAELAPGVPLGAFPSPVIMRRAADGEARSQGQYGFAARYYADWMGQGTDLGAYFVNFHSKLPIAEFSAVEPNATQIYSGLCGGNMMMPATFCTQLLITLQPQPPGPKYIYRLTGLTVAYGLDAAAVGGGDYKAVRAYYPEDIKMFGASFNTSVTLLPEVFGDGMALSGDLAYYPSMPFQVDPLEINAHDLAAAGFVTQPGDAPIYTGETVAPGQWIPGARETKALHGSFTSLSTLTPSNWFVKNTGGDFAVLVANFGFQYLPDAEGNRFATPLNGSHPNPGVANTIGDICIQNKYCSLKPQYADSFSWGYRLYAYQDYHTAFGTGVTISPKIVWFHDVKGYSAGPIGPGFVEGKKSLTLGVDASYQSYKVGISYSSFMGNRAKNKDFDKDFVAMTASYAF